MNFIKTYKETIKKFIMLVLLIISILLLRRELKVMDSEGIRAIVTSKSPISLILMIIGGLIAFNGSFIYDFYLSKDLDIKKSSIYSLAWICQAFSFFIGMFGLTGAYLRQDLYKQLGVDGGRSIQMAMTVTFSSMMGLFFISILGIVPLYRMSKFIYIPGIIILFCIGLVYIFGDKFLEKRFSKKNEFFQVFTRNKRLKLCLLSIIEWLMASIYFVMCVKFFNSEIGFFTGILVYIISVIIGLLSMIPGGFGSFDSSVIILFSYFNISNTGILPALIIFRLGYYLIPFLVGAGLLLKKKLEGKIRCYDYNYYRLIRRFLSMLVLIASVLLILSASTPGIVERIKILNALVPKKLIIFSKGFTIFIGIILGILSRGIYLGVKKTSYATMAISLLVSILCLVKGLDYEESIIMLIIFFLLVYNRKVFTNPAPSINKKSFLRIVVMGLLMFIAYLAIYNTVRDVDFFNGLGKFSLGYLLDNWLLTLTFVAIAISISASLIFTNKYYDNELSLTDEKIEDFEAIRNKYENTAYTHLFYMKDKDIFINSKKNVMFLYKAYKNHVFVLGDPIGEEEDIASAIDEFSNYLIEDDRILSFYQISSRYMESFVEGGFKFLKLGEDALIDLEEFNLEGKSRKNMRHILNKIEQKSFSFKIYEKPHSEEILDELERISSSWLGKKKEMGYSIGAFDRDYLNHCNIFALLDEEGKIQAFANDLEIRNSDILTIDLMRFYREGEESIMEMLLLSIILWAKENSYRYFDLGIAPLSNVGVKNYSPNKEKLVHIAYNYGNRVYGFAGLRHYKEKFKPHWQNIYLAYREETKLAEILFYLVRVCHNLDDGNYKV